VETLQVLETAKRAGATTVAVTNSAASPISSAATHAMLTVVDDGSASRSQALAARHSLLFLIDLIFVAVANTEYGRSLDAFDRASRSVA
ncbi:SIS domain-containing protein, partial [Escherichia coli]|uniref:SIS domain-containing protein n=1 Tax=Escherichia coli TaxID=562 RepID=UPI001CC3A077